MDRLRRSQLSEGDVMRVVSVVAACVLGASLGGCAIFADPNAWPQKFNYADSKNLASGPNVRFVNDRLREMPGDHPLATMCTEPSPDVAVAFGTSIAAQASIAAKGGGQNSGSFNASTSEVATALAGRTASVLALRDGLYATCQAYANGALGQSAYALGLSQYGNLLVALTSVNGVDASGKVIPGPNPVINTPDQSAAAALLVACISEYDPTRLGALDPETRQIKTSRVLDRAFCLRYIETFGDRLTAIPVARPVAKPAPPAKKTGA
jgi:hypothetical protein